MLDAILHSCKSLRVAEINGDALGETDDLVQVLESKRSQPRGKIPSQTGWQETRRMLETR